MRKVRPTSFLLSGIVVSIFFLLVALLYTVLDLAGIPVSDIVSELIPYSYLVRQIIYTLTVLGLFIFFSIAVFRNNEVINAGDFAHCCRINSQIKYLYTLSWFVVIGAFVLAWTTFVSEFVPFVTLPFALGLTFAFRKSFNRIYAVAVLRFVNETTDKDLGYASARISSLIEGSVKNKDDISLINEDPEAAVVLDDLSSRGDNAETVRQLCGRLSGANQPDYAIWGRYKRVDEGVVFTVEIYGKGGEILSSKEIVSAPAGFESVYDSIVKHVDNFFNEGLKRG